MPEGDTVARTAKRLHQALAARCERVVFVVAGLPMVLKGDPL